MESAHDKTGLIRKVAKHSHTHMACGTFILELLWRISLKTRTGRGDFVIPAAELDQHGPGVGGINYDLEGLAKESFASLELFLFLFATLERRSWPPNSHLKAP